jgi:hypothetical protein
MYWAIRTTLYSTLDAEQSPFQAVMPPVRQDALDGVSVELFEDLGTQSPTLIEVDLRSDINNGS